MSEYRISKHKKKQQMKYKYEDNFYWYYSDFFQGVEITFRRNKSTGEIMILFTDEVIQKLFKFESFEKMMQDKEIQKITQEVYKRVGYPLFIPEFDNDDIAKN
jgi:hypothetical protein